MRYVLLHLMALGAFILDREGVFALVVAGAAGLALFHLSHGRLRPADAVREDFGVAVGTLVGLQVELVAEGCVTFRFRQHVIDDARFQAGVTFGAVSGSGKDIFAVMAGAA